MLDRRDSVVGGGTGGGLIESTTIRAKRSGEVKTSKSSLPLKRNCSKINFLEGTGIQC